MVEVKKVLHFCQNIPERKINLTLNGVINKIYKYPNIQTKKLNYYTYFMYVHLQNMFIIARE